MIHELAYLYNGKTLNNKKKGTFLGSNLGECQKKFVGGAQANLHSRIYILWFYILNEMLS